MTSCATWLAATLPGVGEPPPHDDWPARRAYDLRWQRLLFEAGYAGVDWPAEGGGRGSSPVEQLIFKEECERAGAPYVGRELRRPPARRPDHHRRGHGGTEGALPPGHPARRGGVVPGLQRARRGQRPGLAAHPGRPRRRRLRGDRLEDLDVPRRGGRLLRAARAHRGGAQPRHHVADHAHGRARHRDPAAAHHRGDHRVRRAVPRTRCASRWPTASATRTTAGA